jgi:hypothetical protein
VFDWTVTEWLPNTCVNGHRLQPGNVLVGWHPCTCWAGHNGHRTVTCETCGAISISIGSGFEPRGAHRRVPGDVTYH